jgi:membrane-bound lytic murein transglycosylase MltF
LQRFAFGLLGSYQYSCINVIFIAESQWEPTAQSSNSTSYGIGQFLDQTWVGMGVTKTSDGYLQIRYAIRYMDGRYGSPCGALAFRQINGWY